jgi:hypothetical protein
MEHIGMVKGPRKIAMKLSMRGICKNTVTDTVSSGGN